MSARRSCSWLAPMRMAQRATGTEAVMPWFPLPESITTGSSQPLMRASLPAAAQARASVRISSGFSASRTSRCSRPNPRAGPPRRWRGCTSAAAPGAPRPSPAQRCRRSPVCPPRSRTLLSVSESSAESVKGLSNSTSPSRSSWTTFVWLFAMCTMALCSPARALEPDVQQARRVRTHDLDVHALAALGNLGALLLGHLGDDLQLAGGVSRRHARRHGGAYALHPARVWHDNALDVLDDVPGEPAPAPAPAPRPAPRAASRRRRRWRWAPYSPWRAQAPPSIWRYTPSQARLS